MKTELENQLSELKTRNEERVAAAKAKMGTKYLLHPSNRVTRVKVEPLVLSNPNTSFTFVK